MVERPDRPTTVTFFSPDPFSAGVPLTLGDDAAQHARVLRLGSGEPVGLRDGHGNAATGVLTRVAKRSLTIDVLSVWQISDLPSVHLLVPVADRDRMAYLAEKATELGATTWRPVIWRRSRSVGPAGDGPAFNSRLRARMIAALTQSGGGYVPEIHPSAPLGRAIAATPEGTRILLEADAEQSLLDVEMTAPVSIAIGPEGGVEPRERDELILAGFRAASLVGSTLRFETAGIAALAIVRAMLGSTAVAARDSKFQATEELT